MKPLHAGSNYKWLLPFFRKMEKTGRNTFEAGLGGSCLIFEDQHWSFGEYGQVYRIRYLHDTEKYYEIAVNDEKKTATPLRYIDRNAVSLNNTVRDLTEVSCFWFGWSNPCPRPENVRKVDTMLWEWIDYLEHRQFYSAKYA